MGNRPDPGRVAALVRRVLAAALIVLLTAVAVVVIVVARSTLSLAAAVIRIIGHRWFSSCGERMVAMGSRGFASDGIWVDRAVRTELPGVQVR